MRLQLREPVLIAAAARHAVGELQEALGEDALPAVAADHVRVEGDAVQRRRDGVARNALRRRFLLEGLEPLLEAAGVLAGRRGAPARP